MNQPPASEIFQMPIESTIGCGEAKPLKGSIDSQSEAANQVPQWTPTADLLALLDELGPLPDEVDSFAYDLISPEKVRAVIRMKQASQESNLRATHAKFEQLEARLQQIEGRSISLAQTVVLKCIAPQNVVSVRDIIPDHTMILVVIREISGFLEERGLASSGAPVVIYYDDEYREQDIDVEVAVPVPMLPANTSRLTARKLSGSETAASIVHRGSHNTISLAYAALMTWLEEHGYEIAGPNREVYLQFPTVENGIGQCMIEVQFPVRKVIVRQA